MQNKIPGIYFSLTKFLRNASSFFLSHDFYLIIFLIAIGLLLRLPGMSIGLWRDEAATYLSATSANFLDLFQAVNAIELNPPFYFLIMHVWVKIFGTGEIILKLPSLFFGLLLIPTTYYLGRVIKSRNSGIIAALITSFAPREGQFIFLKKYELIP